MEESPPLPMFLMHLEVTDVIKPLGMMKKSLHYFTKNEANILTLNWWIYFLRI
jgi:hypothetical protein